MRRPSPAQKSFARLTMLRLVSSARGCYPDRFSAARPVASAAATPMQGTRRVIVSVSTVPYLQGYDVSESGITPDALPQPLFVTTRWSVVLAAQDKSSPDSAAALETLCRAYWYPLYAYVRGSGRSPHDAQDLTQEFFARLLAQDWLRVVLPE